jgi:hypothetical protein
MTFCFDLVTPYISKQPPYLELSIMFNIDKEPCKIPPNSSGLKIKKNEKKQWQQIGGNSKNREVGLGKNEKYRLRCVKI